VTLGFMEKSTMTLALYWSFRNYWSCNKYVNAVPSWQPFQIDRKQMKPLLDTFGKYSDYVILKLSFVADC
jgi:hypothetical protein